MLDNFKKNEKGYKTILKKVITICHLPDLIPLILLAYFRYSK